MQVTDAMVAAALNEYGCDQHNNDTDAMRAALEAALAEMWQGMDSAPKDGTAIWLLIDGQPYIGYGEQADWLCDHDRWFAKAGIRRKADREPSRIESAPDEIFGCMGVDVHPTAWQPPSTASEGEVTMKIILGYWVVGCAIVGVANAQIINKCPSESRNMFEIAAAVSIWPSFVFGAFVMHPRKRECRPSPEADQ